MLHSLCAEQDQQEGERGGAACRHLKTGTVGGVTLGLRQTGRKRVGWAGWQERSR